MDKATYHCKGCNFKTNNLKDWKRHLSTQKHAKQKLSHVPGVVRSASMRSITGVEKSSH